MFTRRKIAALVAEFLGTGVLAFVAKARRIGFTLAEIRCRRHSDAPAGGRVAKFAHWSSGGRPPKYNRPDAISRPSMRVSARCLPWPRRATVRPPCARCRRTGYEPYR